MRRLGWLLALLPVLALAQGVGGSTVSQVGIPYQPVSPVTVGQCLVFAGTAYSNQNCNSGTSTVTPSSVTTFTNKDLTSATNTLPPNLLNLCTLGACGITDGTTIFNNAVTTATSTGQALYLPGGHTINFNYGATTLPTLNGVSLYCDGETSILNFDSSETSSPHTSLQIEGSNVVVQNCNFQTSYTGSRSTQVYSSAISNPATLTNFAIRNNYFNGANGFAAANLQIQGTATYGDVSGNIMSSPSLANPIIFQSAVTFVNVIDNTIYGSGSVAGDTCIEMADYTATTTPALRYFNVIGNNLANCHSHGISVVGGSHINIVGNSMYNIGARGVYVSSESNTSSADNVNIIGNSINGAGVIASDYYIFVNGRTGFPSTDVTVANNVITMTVGVNNLGIQAGACDTASCAIANRVLFSGNHIEGDGTHGGTGIGVRGGQDVSIDGNFISALQNHAIVINGGDSGTLRITNNHLANLSLQTTATYEAIQLQNPGWANQIISGNDYTAGSNSVSKFLTCTGGSPNIYGNQLQTFTNYSCSTGIYSFPLNTPTSVPTGNTTASPQCFDDMLFNTGVHAYAVTLPTGTAVPLGCLIRLSSVNQATVNFLTVAAGGGSDKVVGTTTVMGGQSVIYEAVLNGSAIYWAALGGSALQGYTIANLPTCNAAATGLMSYVTNGVAVPVFLVAVSTTGSTVAPVFCNGTNWIYY